MAAPGSLLDRLLHWIARAESEQREILLGSLLLLFIMLGGTIGYRIIEGWTWIEAFYMTFITLTTIGFSRCLLHWPGSTGRGRSFWRWPTTARTYASRCWRVN